MILKVKIVKMQMNDIIHNMNGIFTSFKFDFIAMALLAGLGIALVAGPLGSLIVWRRMANFGDAMGHTTLLGVCLALLLNLNLYLGLFGICIITAATMASLSSQNSLPMKRYSAYWRKLYWHSD